MGSALSVVECRQVGSGIRTTSIAPASVTEATVRWQLHYGKQARSQS